MTFSRGVEAAVDQVVKSEQRRFPLRKVLRVVARALIGVAAAVVLALATLTVIWLSRRADPISYLSGQYATYVQVPSLLSVYDTWLNLEAADAVLGRPELAPYRRLVTDMRGLTLTDSAAVRTLLDVHADVMLLDNQAFLAVVDLGWRGLFGPLLSVVGPLLRIEGLSVVFDAGVPMYRFTSGSTGVLTVIRGNVGLITVDAGVMKAALLRHSSRTGLDHAVSADVLGVMKSRSRTAIRIMVDTASLTADIFAESKLGARIVKAIEMPGKSMLDVETTGNSLRFALQLPIKVGIPELTSALRVSPAAIGVLGLVPANASLVSVLNIAPVASLYRLAAAFEGKAVTKEFDKSDSGARSLLGVGIDELFFSWMGAEVGAFTLSGSTLPVFFARITDMAAYQRAVAKLTTGGPKGKGNPLVVNGVRIERISFPWTTNLILAIGSVDIPRASFIERGGYFFLSMDSANLSAVAAATAKGDSLAPFDRYTALTRGTRVDASIFAWYDAVRAKPFFMRGKGVLPDVLRLYPTGAVSVHVSPSEIRLDLVAERGDSGGVQLMHGFPVALTGSLTGDIAAFRFEGSSSASLAWIAGRSTLVLADAGGLQTTKAALEKDSVLVPQVLGDGLVGSLWAVSPGGNVYSFGPGLVPRPPFPVMTHSAIAVGPGLLDGKLALLSRSDSMLRLVGADGVQEAARTLKDGAVSSLPDARAGMLAYSSKGIDARVNVVDAAGTEAPGWPVQVWGLSFGAPRFLDGDGPMVVTFLTRAGALHAWDAAGKPLPGFPVSLPGVYYSNPEQVMVDGHPALITLAQDGALTLVGMDGTVLRSVHVPNLGGKRAGMVVADLNGDGKGQVFLYGSGASIAGYDEALRPLPGFPVKGASRPQLVDIDRDGRLDLVTAGLDGKIYAYTVGQGKA